MKILAFSASNSSTSINDLLVASAIEVLKTEITPGVQIETLDMNDFEMPLYSSDREAKDGVPQQAQDFLAMIGAVDALVISFPEHNGYFPAAFKNLFDWSSRANAKVFQNKPMVAMAATPGPRSGAGVLGAIEQLAPFFGGDVRAVLGLGTFEQSFDRAALRPSDPEMHAKLRQALSTLVLEKA